MTGRSFWDIPDDEIAAASSITALGEVELDHVGDPDDAQTTQQEEVHGQQEQEETPAPLQEDAGNPAGDEPDPDDLAHADAAAGNAQPGQADAGAEAVAAQPAAGSDPAQAPAAAASQEAVAVDYEAAYRKIMAPFRANGKEIKLDSPDEVIQLLQKGANYTQKLQQLQPHLKVTRMLEKFGLLDEAKLSTLIDVHNGDKNAISYLLKSKGIDPLDMGMDSEAKYTPRNHGISEAEHQFRNTTDELGMTDHGRDILIEANANWDDASKEMVFKDPALLNVLAGQKAIGAYDVIAAEVAKQRMLGNPEIANMSFLPAYQAVGIRMGQQGLLARFQNSPANAPAQAPAAASTPAPGAVNNRVLATSTAPKAASNSTDPVQAARIKAASPTGTGGGKQTKPVIDPFEGTDEEFLARFKGRI